MTRTIRKSASPAAAATAEPTPPRKRGNGAFPAGAIASTIEPTAALDPDLAATVSAKPPQSRASKRIHGKFVMPAEDYALIKLLKQRASAAGRPTKKNELLRAGLHALRESGSIELIKALGRLPPVRKRRSD